MKEPAIFRVVLWTAAATAMFAFAACRSTREPRDLMLEEALDSQLIERPVAMRGDATFLDGKVAAVATVTRGFDRGVRGPGHRRGDDRPLGSRRRDRDEEGAFSQVYNVGGYGDSEEDQREAIEDYMRIAKARRAAGSPMPPVTLRVLLENRGTEPMEIQVTEVNSYLGNFAVRPSSLTLAPGEEGALEPMISQLGVTSDEIPLKLELRQGGKKESQVVLVKNVIAEALRKEIEAGQK